MRKKRAAPVWRALIGAAVVRGNVDNRQHGRGDESGRGSNRSSWRGGAERRTDRSNTERRDWPEHDHHGVMNPLRSPSRFSTMKRRPAAAAGKQGDSRGPLTDGEHEAGNRQQHARGSELVADHRAIAGR